MRVGAFVMLSATNSAAKTTQVLYSGWRALIVYPDEIRYSYVCTTSSFYAIAVQMRTKKVDDVEVERKRISLNIACTVPLSLLVLTVGVKISYY